MTDSLSPLPSIAAQEPAPERSAAMGHMRRGTHAMLAEARANAGGGEREFSFPEMLASLNPINHLPFVSYLMPAGAEPTKTGPISNMVFGALIGGPLGLAMSAIGAVFQEAMGQGPLDAAMDAIRGEDTEIAEINSSSRRQNIARYQSLGEALAPSVREEV